MRAVGLAWASPAARRPVDKSPCYCSTRMLSDSDLFYCAFECGGAGWPRCGAVARIQDCFGLLRISSVCIIYMSLFRVMCYLSYVLVSEIMSCAL